MPCLSVIPSECPFGREIAAALCRAFESLPGTWQVTVRRQMFSPLWDVSILSPDRRHVGCVTWNAADGEDPALLVGRVVQAAADMARR